MIYHGPMQTLDLARALGHSDVEIVGYQDPAMPTPSEYRARCSCSWRSAAYVVQSAAVQAGVYHLESTAERFAGEARTAGLSIDQALELRNGATRAPHNGRIHKPNTTTGPELSRR